MATVNEIFNKAKDHLRAIAGDAMAISVKENKKLRDSIMDSKKDQIAILTENLLNDDKNTKVIQEEISKVEKAIKQIEMNESVMIKNPEAITGDLKSGLEDIITTLKEEVRNFDKEVVVKNDLGQLATLFKSSNDRKEVVSVLKAIKDSVDKIEMPDIPDTTALIVRLIETVEGKESLTGILEEIRDKEFFLPPVLSVDLDPNLIENDRIKVVLRDDQVSKMNVASTGNSDRIVDAVETSSSNIITGLDAIEENQTDKTQFTKITDGTDDATITVNADRTTNLDGETGLNTNAMIFGRVSDSIVKNLRSDASTESIMTISYEHHEIHAGTHFFHNDIHDLAINNVLDYQFTTPDTTKFAHFLASFNTESETEYYLYEGATINVAGTDAGCFNSNRNSATTCTINIDELTNTNLANANADTDVSGATVLKHGIIGGGKEGGEKNRSNEIVLKRNTIYVLRFIANSAGYVNTDFEWYEHTDRN